MEGEVVVVVVVGAWLGFWGDLEGSWRLWVIMWDCMRGLGLVCCGRVEASLRCPLAWAAGNEARRQRSPPCDMT